MMDLEKKLEQIKPYQLNCNVFSVYDFPDTYSMQELLNKFFQTINNCVELCNNVLDLAKWLVTIGLEQEVAKKLQQWLEDGTLAKIINEELFGELNAKINKNTNDILELNNKHDILENKITKINDLIKYNALDFNIDNTGVNDITETLNSTIKMIADNGGGTLYLPSGKYKITDTIKFHPYVRLEGAMSWRGKDKEGYSTFECYSKDRPQFLLCEYSSLINFRFIYPNQGETVETLLEYDWLIATDTSRLCDDIQLSDLYMENPYKGINIVNGGRWNIRNIYGQPIKTGLRIDGSLDMGHVDRVEFWTFRYYVGTPIFKWIQDNGTAFELCKFDGALFNNLFAYGYSKCYHFNAS